MKIIRHQANSRGYFDHGWLRTSHTFSFADYYDPQRINFGALRVLNDDSIDPSMGFDLHPHRNMEIVSIPLSGALKHHDSMGNTTILHQGEIQVMSAGSGVLHSEYNASGDKPADFLQIWVIPERMNVNPRYDSVRIDDLVRRNEITEIITPYPGQGKGLWIYQKAWFSMGILTKGSDHIYHFKSGRSFGVYVFVIEGSVVVEGTVLNRRDGQGIYDTQTFGIITREDARVLFIEVPPVSSLAGI